MTVNISQIEAYLTLFQCPTWRMPLAAEGSFDPWSSRAVLEPLSVVSGQHVEFLAITFLWC